MDNPAGAELPAPPFDRGSSAEPEPTLSSLLAQLTDDARSLVRQEIDIARLETTRAAKTVAISGAFIAIGGILLLVGVAVLTVFLIIGFGKLLGDRFWLSSLIVGALFALGGLFALIHGRRGLRRDRLKPVAALDALEATGEWARNEAAEIKRQINT